MQLRGKNIYLMGRTKIVGRIGRKTKLGEELFKQVRVANEMAANFFFQLMNQQAHSVFNACTMREDNYFDGVSALCVSTLCVSA